MGNKATHKKAINIMEERSKPVRDFMTVYYCIFMLVK